VVVWLAGTLRASTVFTVAATLEHIDRDIYDDQAETRDTRMLAEERSHARLLSTIANGRCSGWNGNSRHRYAKRCNCNLLRPLRNLQVAAHEPNDTRRRAHH
jgi:hypothetical protein